MKNERYSIIVSSQTDARKKSSVTSIPRKRLIALVCTAVLIVLTVAGFAIGSAANAAAQLEELEELELQQLKH